MLAVPPRRLAIMPSIKPSLAASSGSIPLADKILRATSQCSVARSSLWARIYSSAAEKWANCCPPIMAADSANTRLTRRSASARLSAPPKRRSATARLLRTVLSNIGLSSRDAIFSAAVNTAADSCRSRAAIKATPNGRDILTSSAARPNCCAA